MYPYPQQQMYGNMPQQMQPNLPVDPTKQMNQVIQLQVGNPPFIPSIRCPQPLQPFLPLITSVAMMEIQSRMTENPLRMFMFNLYSMGMFNNQQFSELIEIAANHIHLSLMSGQSNHQSAEAAIMEITPFIVQIVCGGQIKMYPALQNFISPEMTQAGIQAANAVAQIVSNIAQFMNQNHQSMFMSGNPPGASVHDQRQYGGTPWQNVATHPQGNTGLFGGGFVNQNMPGAQVTGGVQITGSAATGQGANKYRKQLEEQQARNAAAHGYVGGTHQVVQQNTPAPAPYRKSAADFVNKTQQVAQEVLKQPVQPRNIIQGMITEVTGSPKADGGSETTIEKAVANMGGMGNLSYNSTPEVTVAPSQVVQEVTQQVQPVQENKTVLYPKELIPDGRVWKRSKIQPWHPTWHPAIQKCLYHVMDDGTVIAVVIHLREGEVPMDYSKHIVGVTPTRMSWKDDSPNVKFKVEQKVVNKVVKQEIVNIHTLSRSAMVECSDESSIIYSIQEAAVSPHFSNGVDAIASAMCVAELVICENTEIADRYKDAVTRIVEGETFENACDILSELNTVDDLRLRVTLNRTLTKELNSMLEYEMGLEGWKISEFTTDAKEVIKMIREREGDEIADVLEEKQGYFLKRSIELMDDQVAENYQTQSLGEFKGAENFSGCAIYPSSMISITSLNRYAYELNINGRDNAITVLSEDNNSFLYTLSKNLLESVFLDDGGPFRRHYLISKDGVRFEIARGFVNKEAILLKMLG